MKKLISISLTVILLSTVSTYAQEPASEKTPKGGKDKKIIHTAYWNDDTLISKGIFKDEIDPRKYVRVLYKKNPNYKRVERNEKQRVIWNWNDSGYFQKFKVIDNEGTLNIFFDKNGLAQNHKFQGNISLEAHIKSKEGERKIEVNPYSMVGVERKEIGIESFPPQEVAQLLFNSVIETKKTIVLSKINYEESDEYSYDFYYEPDTIKLNKLVEKIEKAIDNKIIKSKSDTLFQNIYLTELNDIIKIYTKTPRGPNVEKFTENTYYTELLKMVLHYKRYTYSALIDEIKDICRTYRLEGEAELKNAAELQITCKLPFF